MSDSLSQSVLLVKVGALRCALPLSCVVETMRPFPQRALAGAPEFVSGVSVIRGQPVPVVSLSALLGVDSAAPARFVVVHVGQRSVALAVEAVVGALEIAAEDLGGVPPLLAQAQARVVDAIGVLDKELLLVLQAASIVPDELWPLLAEPGQR